MTEFTIASFNELVATEWAKPVAPRFPVTTGLVGMASLDFAFAAVGMGPTKRMTRTHPQLLWSDSRRSIAVDENGKTWMWGLIRGKIWWIFLDQYADKQPPSIPTRFNDWEANLNQQA